MQTDHSRDYITQIVNSLFIGNNATDVTTVPWVTHAEKLKKNVFYLRLVNTSWSTSKRSLMTLLNPSILTIKLRLLQNYVANLNINITLA